MPDNRKNLPQDRPHQGGRMPEPERGQPGSNQGGRMPQDERDKRDPNRGGQGGNQQGRADREREEQGRFQSDEESSGSLRNP